MIQWISIRKTNCGIHWIEIYPGDSSIHLPLLNNYGQVKYEPHNGLVGLISTYK